MAKVQVQATATRSEFENLDQQPTSDSHSGTFSRRKNTRRSNARRSQNRRPTTTAIAPPGTGATGEDTVATQQDRTVPGPESQMTHTSSCQKNQHQHGGTFSSENASPIKNDGTFPSETECLTTSSVTLNLGVDGQQNDGTFSTENECRTTSNGTSPLGDESQQ